MTQLDYQTKGERVRPDRVAGRCITLLAYVGYALEIAVFGTGLIFRSERTIHISAAIFVASILTHCLGKFLSE